MFENIWFILWGLLWAIYFFLDGFDLGVGIIYNFIAKNEEEKKLMIRTIAPFWDGNEVWLITAGGATFAAFPTTYAYMFSYLYIPLLIILLTLILRGVGIEFRNKVEDEKLRRIWDYSIFIGSLVPTLIFGVAFGNIFKGLRIGPAGYEGTLISLFNLYAIICGVTFLTMFLLHGLIYLILKLSEELLDKFIFWARRVYYLVVISSLSFLFLSFFYTKLFKNYFKMKILFFILVIMLISLIFTGVYIFKKKFGLAFTFSSLLIIFLVLFGVIGIYPNLIPSSIDEAYSLTIFNSSSSQYTLKIMTFVAFLFVPIVIGYQIWVYKVLKGKITLSVLFEEKEIY